MDIDVDEFDYLGEHIIFPRAPSRPPPTLLTLPPRIRENIYRHVFIAEFTRVLSGKHTITYPPQFNKGVMLLFVNPQIHREAAKILYDEYYPRLHFEPSLPREGISLFNSLGRYHPHATAQIITVPDFSTTGWEIESVYTPIGLLHPNVGAYLPVDMLQLGLKHCALRGCGGDQNPMTVLRESEKGDTEWYLCGPDWRLKATFATSSDGPTECVRLERRMGAFHALSGHHSPGWMFLEKRHIQD